MIGAVTYSLVETQLYEPVQSDVPHTESILKQLLSDSHS